MPRARTADGRRRGDQSRFMQNRPVYMTARRKGEPIPTNDWWTDALVSRWTGNLWSYPTKVDGIAVSRRIPVEEALVARKLAYSPANISAIVGEGVKMSVSCEDQFGGKMSLKGSKTSVTAPSGRPAVTGKDYKTAKGGIFIPLAKGTYVLRTELGGMSAESGGTRGPSIMS